MKTVVSIKSNIVHTQDCNIGKKIKSTNKIEFNNAKDPINMGYIPCYNCFSMKHYYKIHQSEIDYLINKNGLGMYIEGNCMYIENMFAAWKIELNQKDLSLILYHANTESYASLERKDGHLIHHYHLQKYKGKNSIPAMIEYLIEHDKWKENDLDSYKKMPTTTKNDKKRYRKAELDSKKKKISNVRNLIEKIQLEEQNKNKNK